MPNKIAVVFLFTTAFLFSCQTTPPEWIQYLEYEPEEIYDIEIGSYGYPYVSVSLNGNNISLPWDTGNMSRLAITQDIADNLELPIVDEATSYASDGSVRGSRSVYRVDSVKIFKNTWRNFRAVELDHPNLDGLVGPYFVEGKRFTLDYRNNLFAVTDKPLPADRPGEELELVKSPIHELLIIIYAEVNGRKILAEIDTGKSRSVIDPQLAEQLGLVKLDNGYKIEQLSIGSHKFSVPSARATNFGGISEGLPEVIQLGIGSDILSGLILTVDYNEGVLLIQQNE